MCLDHPLLHLLGLTDALVGLLRRNLFPVLQDVSLDQVPILELFLLKLLFLAAMFHLFAFLFVLDRLNLGKRNANFVLLGQYVKQITLLLLHLELKFANFFLLLFHLLAKLFEWVGVRVLLVVRVLQVDHFLSTLPPVTFRVAELDFHIDGTAFHREEADVNIACLESFSLLVGGMHEEYLL